MPDDKPTDVAGAPLHFMAKADTPLILQIGCDSCKAALFIVAVVVPGFHFPCSTCEQKVDKGVVLACSACGIASCAPCVYKQYLKSRAAQLTPQ